MASRAERRRRKKAADKLTKNLPSSFRGGCDTPEKLAALGPLVHGVWAVPIELADHLARKGRPVPKPVAGALYLDTGATRTCIAQEAASALGLKPTRVGQGFGASGAHTQPIYRARLSIGITDGKSKKRTMIEYPTEAAGIPELGRSGQHLGITAGGQPVQLIGLLGRDLLKHTVVTYNGLEGWFEVDFDLSSMKQS